MMQKSMNINTREHESYFYEHLMMPNCYRRCVRLLQIYRINSWLKPWINNAMQIPVNMVLNDTQ